MERPSFESSADDLGELRRRVQSVEDEQRDVTEFVTTVFVPTAAKKVVFATWVVTVTCTIVYLLFRKD